MNKIIIASSVFLSSFSVAYAAITPLVPSTGANTGLATTTQIVMWYLLAASQLVMAAAAVWVLWNAFKFIMAAGEAEKRDEARSGIIYGLIGLAVMASLWGLIAFVSSSAGVSAGTQLPVPSVIF